MTPPSITLCVYCGSRQGTQPAYTAAARHVGDSIGRRGWRLVYGGGRNGLMGTVADAAIDGGAHVTGIIPSSLMQREVGHPGVSELHVVQTMHERKRMMAERADAFLALPGGLGTFEELFEVWTWRQLGYHDKPVGLLNVAGYYDTMLDFVDRSVSEEFLSKQQRDVLQVSDSVETLLDALDISARRAVAPDDYRKI